MNHDLRFHRPVNISPTSSTDFLTSFDIGSDGKRVMTTTVKAAPSSCSSVRDIGVHPVGGDNVDLVIEINDALFDLSNLLSAKRPHLKCASPFPTVKKKTMLKKQRSYRRLYPTILQVSQLPELVASDVLAKCIINKRTTWKSDDSYSSTSNGKKKYEYSFSKDAFGQSLPGAYECNPHDLYDAKPAVKTIRETTSECYTRHIQEHTDWMNRNASSTLMTTPWGARVSNGLSNQNVREGDCMPAFQPTHSTSAVQTNPYGRNELLARGEIIQLEIEPGIFAPLRGSNETWNAIQEGDSIHVSCFCCSASLLCIADADYVLCPECRVVSPTDAGNRKVPAGRRRHRGGVGLGLQTAGSSFAAAHIPTSISNARC